jgi:hypothetical protein
VSVTGVRDRQAEKLEGPVKGQAAIFDVVFAAPREGPFDFAPDVGQLHHEREALPASRGKIAMLYVHDVMSFWMMMIFMIYL